MPLFITGRVNRGISPKVADESIAYIIPENLFMLLPFQNKTPGSRMKARRK